MTFYSFFTIRVIRLFIHNYNDLSFRKVKKDIFPVYNFFNNIDKEKPQNLIKFNIGNEYAVNLFKNKKINYTDIYRIIKKVTSLNLYSTVKTIKDIIKYHEEIENRLKNFIFQVCHSLDPIYTRNPTMGPRKLRLSLILFFLFICLYMCVSLCVKN